MLIALYRILVSLANGANALDEYQSHQIIALKRRDEEGKSRWSICTLSYKKYIQRR